MTRHRQSRAELARLRALAARIVAEPITFESVFDRWELIPTDETVADALELERAAPAPCRCADCRDGRAFGRGSLL